MKNAETIYSNTENGIDEICAKLYVNYPFYGYIMVNVNRRFTDNKNYPTACVNLNNEMIINREFWAGLTETEKVAVLEHEILHLALLHIPRFFNVMREDSSSGKLANIAMDCAINQYINGLPEYCVTLDTIKQMVGDDVEVKARETAEYYYQLLKSKSDEAMEKLQQMMDADPDFKKMIEDMLQGHGQSATGSADETGDIDPVLESAMRRLLDSCKEKHLARNREKGNHCGDDIINILPTYVTIDKNVWRHLINKMVGETPVATQHPVYNKPNRRHPKSNWGKSRDLVASRVWVVVDTSGSITDDELSMFCGHISKAIKSEGVIVDLIQCDHDIQQVDYNLRHIKKGGINIHGRGGTDMVKAIDFIRERSNNKKQRAIILTDGYTDWAESNIEWTAIYTKNHTELPNMKYSCTLDS